jgi:HPt (histidine-containing phosphotransfer) domain-containing protein
MSLDKSKALRTFSIPESQYDELLLEFVTLCEEKLVSLDSAISKSEFAEAAAIIHAVKGMAGNMMLDDCYAASRTIEHCIKQNDNKGAVAGIDTFRQSVKEIRIAISKNNFL